MFIVFFFKQKTAYEMRISDWSSDVCSSDLAALILRDLVFIGGEDLGDLGLDRTGVARLLQSLAIDDHARGVAAFEHLLDRKSTRLTPVTNAHLVCRLLLEKKKNKTTTQLRTTLHS